LWWGKKKIGSYRPENQILIPFDGKMEFEKLFLQFLCPIAIQLGLQQFTTLKFRSRLRRPTEGKNHAHRQFCPYCHDGLFFDWSLYYSQRSVIDHTFNA